MFCAKAASSRFFVQAAFFLKWQVRADGQIGDKRVEPSANPRRGSFQEVEILFCFLYSSIKRTMFSVSSCFILLESIYMIFPFSASFLPSADETGHSSIPIGNTGMRFLNSHIPVFADSLYFYF